MLLTLITLAGLGMSGMRRERSVLDNSNHEKVMRISAWHDSIWDHRILNTSKTHHA